MESPTPSFFARSTSASTSESAGLTRRPEAAEFDLPSRAGGGPAISGPREASTIRVRVSNQAGDFRVAKFLQQRPDIPVKRLLPNILP